MSNHTPGPWYVVPVHARRSYVCHDGPNGRLELAEVYSLAEYGTLPGKANASLIVAAPALADALADLLSTLPFENQHLRHVAAERARAALKQAGR